MSNWRVIKWAGLFVVAAITCGLGHHFGGNGHIRRKLGQAPLANASCLNCHFVSAKRQDWANSKSHHDSPAGLAITPDGNRLLIALDDRDEIAEASIDSLKILRRVKVPGMPYGLAIDPAGDHLFVTCKHDDLVRVLELRSLREIGSVQVGMGPVAIAFCRTSEGDRLVVANSMSDDISIVGVSPLKELSRLTASREPFAVAATADGTRAFVANRLVGLASVRTVPESELTVVNPATARVVRRDALASAHLSEGVCLVPSRSWSLTPLVKVRNLVPITQVANGWVMSSGLALTDLKSGGTIQIPLDEANDSFSDPSSIVTDPQGHRAYIASGGGDVVSVVDLDRVSEWLSHATSGEKREAIYDLSLSSEYVTKRLRTGRNPRHLAMSSNGNRLFVAEHLNDSVLVIDTARLTPVGRIVLGDGGLTDPIRRGERVFTSSAYTFQHQFSCRSCHPDGHVDGLNYDFDGDGIGDNLLDNRSLQGVAGTGPFKWNGKNASLEVQCGPRFAKVLMRTEPFPDQQLHDLTTFIRSLPPPRATRSDAQLTPAAQRGRAIFFASRTSDGKEIPVASRCVTCHPPPLYSVRLPFKVGTKGEFDTTEAFDTPHLLGVADTAPYLHDGRAQTLEEIWTLYSTNDSHGVTSYMNKIQLNDLVEFLKTL
jgi:DNA-binding beta-propeller fold protein YncE